MQALKLNEVLLRVVAWHNRHPLARRIGPSQVHSIGEVLLPFASAQPLGGALATPPAPPELARWVPRPLPGGAAARPPPTPTQTPTSTQALPGLGVDTLLPGDAAADRGAAAADLAASTSAAEAEAEAADFDPFAPDPVDDAAAEPAPDSDRPVAPLDEPPARHSDALAGLADGTPALADGHAAPAHAPATIGHAEDTGPAAPQAAATWAAPAAVAARPGPAQRLLARLRTALTGRRPGLPRLKPAFSRDFIWPLTPRQVARWAQRHGETQALAPADWPRRTVDTDPAQLAGLRQQGLAHSVQLHVLTAAIGVGDRRIRVLMDAHGAIIGPRSYSRPRQASAAVLLAAVMLSAGLGLRPAAVRSGADAAVLAAVAASAAEATASAAAASAARPAEAAALAAVAPASSVGPDNLLAVAPSPADAPPPETSAATASAAAAPAPAQTRQAAEARAHAAQAAPAAQAVTAPEAQAAVEPAPPPPPADPAAPLGRIRPALSVEQRQAARQQAAELRAVKPPAGMAAPKTAPAAAAAPAPVYAVVTRPKPLRETAAQGLALMRATSPRLPPPTPSHGELMQNQGQWRAAWWPFASLADAERARVMLAGRGLKTDVVEF